MTTDATDATDATTDGPEAEAVGGGTETGEAPTGAETAPDSTVPEDEELTEPSTEKDPGEEPKAAKPMQAEPDHEATGIGVFGTPPEES